MANKKVSQLVSKPSVLVTDLFPIADPTTGQLFKTTISDLGTAIGSGVSSVNTLVGAVVLDTDDIQELVSPTNKWFTDTRARAAISGGTGISYNSGTGVITNAVTSGQIATALGYTPADDALVVKLAGSQTITGTKTFQQAPLVDIGVGFKDGNGLYNVIKSLNTGWEIPVNAWNHKLLFSTTSNYDYTFPSVSGTVALVSNLGSYVPYTGATGNVDLGTHTLSSHDLVVNHGSGSGVAASITKGGNGEALTVVKSSGSGNAASITGGVTLLDELHLNTDLADAYIKSATTWNAKVSGSGTANYHSKFTGANTLGNSLIYDDGTNVTINGTAGTALFNVQGSKNAATAIAIGTLISPTLVASANNDALVGLDVNPVYSNGAFTGVSNISLRVSSASFEVAQFLRVGTGSSRITVGNTAGTITTIMDANSTTGAAFGSATNTDVSYVVAQIARLKIINTTGNVILQNGGTFTDAGYRLDVQGTARVSSNLTASSFIKSGGTSAQFLKADGSVDSSTYLTTGTAASTYLPLAGGTLSGTLTMDGSGSSANPIQLIFNTSVNRLLTPVLRLYGATSIASNYVELLGTNATQNRTVNFPDASGTVALTSQLSAYLPLSGGTLTGALSGTSATFSGLITSNRITNAVFTAIASTTNRKYLEIVNDGGQFYAGIGASTSNSIFTGQSAYSTVLGSANSTPLELATNGAVRITITSGGAVGIGTTSPGAKLEVVDSGGSQLLIGFGGVGANYYDATNHYFRSTSGGSTRLQITSTGKINITNNLADYSLTLVNTNTSGYGIYIQAGGTNNLIDGYNSTGATNTFRVSGTGVIFSNTLGTGLVYSNAGSLTSTNPSDSRLKTNITTIAYGLKDILKLRAVSYNWKDDKVNQGLQFGFIAQEVQKIMPDAIKEFGDETKFLGLEKDAIYATLVNAIQELKAELDSLKI